MRDLLRHALHSILPRTVRARRIHFGLARGAVANIDFSRDLAFYFGRHEPELHPHYRRLLRPGMRCFDVGAYRGWDALTMSLLTSDEVVSFDGTLGCIEAARAFLEPSGTQCTLVCRYLNDGSSGGHTLDSAAEEFFVPDLIKIDVEGAEESVLAGARDLLSKRHPSLVIEVHSQSIEQGCLETLKACGYGPQIIKRRLGVFTEARSLEHNRWLVCEGREPSSAVE